MEEWLRTCSMTIVFVWWMNGWGYEMFSVRHCDSVMSRRNILVYDGQMMIVMEYHNSMKIMDDVKVCRRQSS